ncbi:uncharacterized protein UTRI_05647 [Ustilago trichophora]|uniref:Glycerophosphocholine acyltransferase 1 n=1 Tax=Ustilago trichophora TaxID=86804 RepID=A0A5C3EEK6_9BASI|nr:uncharacterized protein UTRI_05647 [Ustilago trichophora]
MRRASSTSSAYSDGSSPGLERPSLSRASSIAYSDDGSATPYRSHSASASVEGIDLLGSSNGALPLSDLFETYFSPRLDLAGRKWSAFSGDMKSRARRRREELVRKAKSKRELQQMDDELKKMRQKVSKRIENLQQKWMDAKVVRLRDKVSFVVGVCNLVVSSLVFALKPEFIPTLYSVLALYFLPLRVWSYTSKKWHYFLFDFCYTNSSASTAIHLGISQLRVSVHRVLLCSPRPAGFQRCNVAEQPCLSQLGKNDFALYPSLSSFCLYDHGSFHAHKEAVERFPALGGLKTLNGYTAFWFNVTIYLVWQLVYYELIVIRKKSKIATGERINSYSTMSKGKGPVANLLGKAPPKRREPAFMLLQFVYTIITTLPAPLILYPSSMASGIFFTGIFVISVWNGASYYVEVFGRRFEKELLALKQEMEVMRATESAVSGASGQVEKEDEAQVEGEAEGNEEEAAAAASGLPQTSGEGEKKKDQ